MAGQVTTLLPLSVGKVERLNRGSVFIFNSELALRGFALDTDGAHTF